MTTIINKNPSSIFTYYVALSERQIALVNYHMRFILPQSIFGIIIKFCCSYHAYSAVIAQLFIFLSGGQAIISVVPWT